MRNKITTIVLCLVIACCLTVSGIFAYKTDTDQTKNVFTHGNIKIELWESFVGHDKDIGPSDEDPVFVGLMPGQTVVKGPYIKNTGANESWVYISIGVPKIDTKDGEVELLSYSVNDKWKLVDKGFRDEHFNYYCYGYEDMLEVGEDIKTEKIFTTVTMTKIGAELLDGIRELKMPIYGFGIQNIEAGVNIGDNKTEPCNYENMWTLCVASTVYRSPIADSGITKIS